MSPSEGALQNSCRRLYITEAFPKKTSTALTGHNASAVSVLTPFSCGFTCYFCTAFGNRAVPSLLPREDFFFQKNIGEKLFPVAISMIKTKQKNTAISTLALHTCSLKFTAGVEL